jgi:hypothetical protein
MVIERLKARSYAGEHTRDYFWRTWEQKEIDLIEESGGRLNAFEFKWSPRKTPKAPRQFMDAYPGATYQTVGPDNFLRYL